MKTNNNLKSRCLELVTNNINMDLKVNNIENIVATLDKEFYLVNTKKCIDKVLTDTLSTLGKNKRNVDLCKEVKKGIDKYLVNLYGSGLDNLKDVKFIICDNSFFVKMTFKSWNESTLFTKAIRIYHNNFLHDVNKWDYKYLSFNYNA